MPNTTLSLMMRNAGTRFFVASAVRQVRSAASILPVRGEASGAFFRAGDVDLDFALDFVRCFAVSRERGLFFGVATFFRGSTLVGTWIAANVCGLAF